MKLGVLDAETPKLRGEGSARSLLQNMVLYFSETERHR